jgi:hypothetical protein
MLGPGLGGVLFGAQVDRTQRVALTAQVGDLLLERVGWGHRLGRVAQRAQKPRGRQVAGVVDGLVRDVGAFGGGFAPDLGRGAGLARLRGGALGSAGGT